MARSIRFLLLSILLVSECLHSEPSENCFFEVAPSLKDKLRLAAVKRFDQFLDLVSSSKLRTFTLLPSVKMVNVANDLPELVEFSELYGYFSLHPIIGRVSKDPQDTQSLLCLLKELSQIQDNDVFAAFAIAELIAKGLAYCDLKQGQSLILPIKNGASFSLEVYTVDRVFDLWNGMPAFGLVPERPGTPSLLLFRGTDFTPSTKRGWASLLSDVDMAGPGLSVFLKARDELHQWLSEVASEEKKANVLGFSLGGSFAVYAFLYEGDLLNETGSIAFNPPGISESVLEEWNSLPKKRRSGFITYINRGDIVSKTGLLFGPAAYELSTELTMKPLFAHTVLMCGQPSFTIAQIDVAQENAQRFK